MKDSAVLKILMVDDDKFLLNMYGPKFKKYGHEVYSVTNGSEALDKLREGLNPDAIILDIIMPSPDGLEILEAIKKEKLAENSAIIMLTNQGATKEIERAKELGMDGYIVKAALIPSEIAVEVLRITEERKKKNG